MCANAGSAGSGCDIADGRADCADSLDCGSDGLCGGLGAECSADNNLLCNAGLFCIAGLCSDLAPDAAECDGDNEECQSGHCINLRCANASPVGGHCDAGDNSDCAGVGCGLDLTCGGLGAAGCGNLDTKCFGPLVCSHNNCSAKIELGDGCDGDNSDCGSGHCISNICSLVGGLGEDCDVGDDTDCSTGIFCGIDGACGGSNANCTPNDDSSCAESEGLVCIFNQCAERGLLDSLCEDNTDCESGLSCVPSIGCQPLGDLGASCNDDSDCLADIRCAPNEVCGGSAAACSSNDDNLCDFTTGLSCILGQCSALVTAPGPCGENNDCVSGVCVLGKCGTSGTLYSPCDETADCENPLDCGQDETCGGLGASCSSPDILYCHSSLRCREGTCKEPQGAGGFCEDNRECASNVCVSSSCLAEPSAVSGPCDVGDHNDCVLDLHCGSEGVCGGTTAVCGNNNDQYCASPRVCVLGFCMQPLSNGNTCQEPEDCQERCILAQCSSPQPLEGDCHTSADCQGSIGCFLNVCGGEGSACTDASTCVSGTFCLPGIDKCAPQRANGASCVENFYCQSGACIDSLCAPQSMLGEPCNDDSDCMGSIHCGLDGSCGSNGAMCISGIAGTCRSGLVCVSDECGPPKMNGETCERNSDCLSGRCLNMECGAYSGLGGTCQSSSECIGAGVECTHGVCGANGGGVRLTKRTCRMVLLVFYCS